MQFLPRLKKIEWLVIILLIIGYLTLALTNLTRLPIFVDEAIYLRWAQIAWHDASWRFISLTDGKQPLYIWFVIPFMKFIADPLAAGRVASVMAGLGFVTGMGYLGYLLRDKKTGFFAMLLSLFSPYLFFYYRFGIMESLLLCGIIWVCIFSVLLTRTRRLDIAMILGMITGLTLLVKSSALFYCLLIPASYLLTVNWKQLWRCQLVHFLILISVVWVLAFVIYNIQRLSPWMHMIGQKNAFFTVAYSEIFADLGRLTNNFKDVWRWQYSYTTLPILLMSLVGAWLLYRRDTRTFLLNLIWLFGPMLGTIMIARLFSPRYIIYVTPFILLFAAVTFASLKSKFFTLVIVLLTFLLPLKHINSMLTDPIHYPYVSVDEGYVNGWSAGNGIKQLADWAVNQVKVNGPITVFTEGTFGILPHGLELYADGRVDGLTIRGLYPINMLPPSEATISAKTSPTYLIMNNTPTPSDVPNLKLLNSYPKRDPAYSMRLFLVTPEEP